MSSASSKSLLLPILLLARIFGWTSKAIVFEDAESGGEVGAAAGEDVEEERVQFGSQVPFGPMLALAGLLYFLGLDKLVDAYFLQIASDFLIIK